MDSIHQLAEKPVCIRLKNVSTLVNFCETFLHDKQARAQVSRQVWKKRSEIASEVSAWLQPSKLVEIARDRLPCAAFFAENDPWIPALLGSPGLNEIEYSTNAYFKNAKLKWCSSGVLHFLVRNYFGEKPFKMYADESANFLSTSAEECGSTAARKLKWPAAILRIDHRLVENSSPRQQHVTDFSASAKLKIFERKYFVEGVEVKLSCSTEVDGRQFAAPSLATLVKNLDKCWKNVTYIVYWYVILSSGSEEGPSTDYRFRVAFRATGKPPRTMKLCPMDFLNKVCRSGTPATCNVECEDEIAGSLFLDCAKALFAYYKFQYEIANEIEAELSPSTLTSFVSSENGRELTETQRAMLGRMKVARACLAQDTGGEVGIPNSLLCNFVSDLALKVWAKAMVKYDSKYASSKSEDANSQFSLPSGSDQNPCQ